VPNYTEIKTVTYDIDKEGSVKLRGCINWLK